MKRLDHRPELDGLRGVAILLVMLAHLGTPGFRAGGVTGVTLFFTLSGFLITSLLIEELAANDRIRIGAFYGRRALRLLPALVSLLIVGIIWEAIAGNTAQTVVFAMAALFYLGNWLAALAHTWLGPWFGHTWSLAIEEQFYLLWPALLLIARPITARRATLTAGLLLVAAVAAMAERLVLWRGPGSEDRIYNGTDTRCDALLLGAAVAVWAFRFGFAKTRWPTALLGTALFAAATPMIGTRDIYLVAPSIAAVGGALMLAYLAPGERGHLLRRRPLRFTGRISYGLYLWHVPLTYVLLPRLAGEPYPVRAAAFFALAYAAALLSWRYVERPFLRRKSKLAAQLSRTTEVDASKILGEGAAGVPVTA